MGRWTGFFTWSELCRGTGSLWEKSLTQRAWSPHTRTHLVRTTRTQWGRGHSGLPHGTSLCRRSRLGSLRLLHETARRVGGGPLESPPRREQWGRAQKMHILSKSCSLGHELGCVCVCVCASVRECVFSLEVSSWTRLSDPSLFAQLVRLDAGRGSRVHEHSTNSGSSTRLLFLVIQQPQVDRVCAVLPGCGQRATSPRGTTLRTAAATGS